jgi:hypothetical protein
VWRVDVDDIKQDIGARAELKSKVDAVLDGFDW